MTPSANDTSQLSPHVGRCTALNQDQLGHYLAGLMEGDGSFGPHKLEIAYHGKDKSAAYGLRSCLGYGQVYPYSRNRHAVRFVILNRAGRTHVLNLVNGKLVHDAKVDQLKHNGYDQLIPVLPALKKVTLNNHWLAGFLDADGSLGIAIAPSKTHKTGQSVRLEVKLSQRDPYLLQALAKVFGVSKIYQCNTKVDFTLNITGLARLKKMFVYLDEFKLRSKKYVQYLLLRKAYLAMVQNHHSRPDGLRRMAALKARVQNVYKLRRPGGSSETTRSTPAVPNAG